jgi:hypothetical protein
MLGVCTIAFRRLRRNLKRPRGIVCRLETGREDIAPCEVQVVAFEAVISERESAIKGVKTLEVQFKCTGTRNKGSRASPLILGGTPLEGRCAASPAHRRSPHRSTFIRN